MPILTSVGLLQGGLISDAARQRYVDDTNTLLLNGSGDFMMGSLPDPVLFPGVPFLSESFNVQPLEVHQATFPVWHKVFIDFMFQATANALDVDGSTPLAPICDFTAPFAKFGFPLRDITIPDFAVGMALPDPTFQAHLEFFFDVDPIEIPPLLPDLLLAVPIPTPTIPPIPPIPPLPLDFAFDVPFGLSLPPFPDLILPPIPPVEFDVTLPLPVVGFLLCAVVKAVPAILAALIAEALTGKLIEALAEGPVGLVAFVAAVVLDAVLSCLGINLKNVLTFLAGFLVYIERLVAMLVVVLVGCIFGEGLLIQVVAKALRLV